MVEKQWIDRLAGRAGGPLSDARPEELAVAAARAASEKLGRDIVVLSVGDVRGSTDCFVIPHGGTDRQVRAIVDGIETDLGNEYGIKPVRVEGLDSLVWVLMDYGSFVVHVFDEETRRFYELERLWKDAPRVEWEA